ncbi:FecCD family ABC transporter permease [Actinosynnema pretiosum]|uniref:FecCD family ABC transporter permease n=1 Tax=Actinosynnema pretiosum TaxID=42197 RepID=UPI000A96E52D|nr:iron ABC transporter permease [Actinosynnema pretiosum]
MTATGTRSAATVPLPKRPGRLRFVALFTGLAATFAVVTLVSTGTGQLGVPVSDVLASLAHRVGLAPAPLDRFTDSALWAIRFPRVVMTVLVGGVCGALMQGTFGNPLAEPGVVGVSSGAAVGALAVARRLDLLTLGDRQARHVGVDVERLRLLVICLVAVGVSAAVSYTGVIGFVGLVVPHLVRMAVGPGHRVLVPASLLGGAVLLSAADLLARTLVAHADLPIGMVTALVGQPVEVTGSGFAADEQVQMLLQPGALFLPVATADAAGALSYSAVVSEGAQAGSTGSSSPGPGPACWGRRPRGRPGGPAGRDRHRRAAGARAGRQHLVARGRGWRRAGRRRGRDRGAAQAAQGGGRAVRFTSAVLAAGVLLVVAPGPVSAQEGSAEPSVTTTTAPSSVTPSTSDGKPSSAANPTSEVRKAQESSATTTTTTTAPQTCELTPTTVGKGDLL